MSAHRRNILVGLTVIGGLVILGWMMLRFGTAPAKLFQKGQRLQVHFIGNRADGLAGGAQVLYRGVPVGQITQLRRDPNQRDVLIDAEINDTPPLPGNVEGIIRTQSLISGSSALSLDLIGGTAAEPKGQLKNGQIIQARYVGTELIPPQFATLASELSKTTQDVQKVRLIAHLDETVRSATDVMKSLDDYVSDPKMRADLRAAISNFREVTERADRSAANIEKFSGSLQKVTDDTTATLADVRTTVRKTQGNLDDLTKQLSDRLLQVSKLLDSFQSIATKVDKGQGTMGLLLNDPKLYQSLVDTSRELNSTVADLQRLFQQWEQEGLYLKLR